MATLSIISNPRRKRRKGRKARKARVGVRRARRTRRTRVLKVASNPKRRKRRSRKAFKGFAKRRRRGGSRSSLSVRGVVANTKGLVKNAAYAAVGAIGLDLAWAYLPLPPVLRSGYVRFVTKGAGAVAIGMIAERVVGRDLAAKLALGAMTVVLHEAMRDAIGQFAPGVALNGSDFPSMGYYGSAPVAGLAEYDVGALPNYYGDSYSQSGNFQGVGEYNVGGLND